MTKPQQRTTLTENFVKFGGAVFEIRERADRERETCQDADKHWFIGNESVLKIIINDTIIFFLNRQSTFWYLQTITVSECRLIKLLPHIFFEKNISISALEIASVGNRHCAKCIGALSFPIRHEVFVRFLFAREQLHTVVYSRRGERKRK